jgi:hypothetical protein
MTDKRRPVEHDIYADRGTLYQPRNKPPRPQRVGSDNSHVEKQDGVRPHLKDEVFNTNVPQHPANFHDKLYDNDVRLDSWLRSNDATTKPGFDKHDNSWRSDSKGNRFGRETTKDYRDDHNRHWTEQRHPTMPAELRRRSFTISASGMCRSTSVRASLA